MAEKIMMFGPAVAAASGIWTDVSQYHPGKSLYVEGLGAGESMDIRAANGPKPSSSASGSLLVTLTGGTSPQFYQTGLMVNQFDWLITNKTVASGSSTSAVLSAEVRRQ